VRRGTCFPGPARSPHTFTHSIGNQGRDIAIDVAIVDSQKGGTGAELQRRALATGIAARQERRRRSATKGARRELLQWMAHIVFDNMMDDLHVIP
jgi:hypothetical protein